MPAWTSAAAGSPSQALPAAQEGAEPAMPTMASAASLQDEIARKRAALQTEFAELRRRLEEASRAETYADRDALLKEVDSLRQLERLYGQQAALAQIRGETTVEQKSAEEELRQLRASGVTGDRPFSFLVLDRLQDEREGETSHLLTLDSSVTFVAQALEQARQSLDTAERTRRALQEAVDTNDDAAQRVELESQLHLAKLASQVAEEEVRLRELEYANEKLKRDVVRLRLTALDERVALVSREAVLRESELRGQIVKLDNEEFELSQVLDKVRREMMSPPGVGAGGAHPNRQVVQLRFSVLSERLQQLADLKQIWSRRFALANGTVNPDDLPTWEAEARRQLERAEGEERVYTSRLVELRRSGQEAGEGGATPGEEPADVEERVKVYETALSNVESFRRTQERLLAQITAITAHETLEQRLRNMRRLLATAWDYEIVAVQDRPITVGKIVLGILLFAVGLYVSRLVSRFLGRRLFPRFGLDPGASAALQSLSYYILVVVMALIALQAVNVPLTLFTVVGGALAIGVGFGSQNIVNNFISGLILLAERPIKVGDLVEIGEMTGTVEMIGARSTRVRTSKNIHVIVPNSHFLEREVVNWTLVDDLVKTSVCVGVAYGSATERVRELLVEAVSHHDKIFSSPAPVVLFRDFAESSLNFEVFFWVRVRTVFEKWTIESDVRGRIDELFRQAGIVIAFPQRDVHLEAVGPLEVRVRRE